MAGGTWSDQNKSVPGVYINYQGVPATLGGPAPRGIGTMPLLLSWGPFETFITLQNGEDTFPVVGHEITDPTRPLIMEFFKGSDSTAAPQTLLLWRLQTTGGVKATATPMTGLTATALYTGVLGNQLTVTSVADPNISGSFDVTTTMNGTIVDVQTASTFGGLKANQWVTFSGTSGTALAAFAATALTTGADGTLDSTSYGRYLTALQTQTFQSLAYTGTDANVQWQFISFTEQEAAQQGVDFTCVLGAIVSGANVDTTAATANNPYVISVRNGYLRSDGTTISAAQAAAWVAGASAGASYTQSLTYAAIPGATAVNPAVSPYQLGTDISQGSFCLQLSKQNTVQVVSDVNTFTSYTSTMTPLFSKNRPIRTQQQIANDIQRIFSQYVIGKISGNTAGMTVLKGIIVTYMNTLQGNQAIQAFSATDVTVALGNTSDSAVITIGYTDVDSLEKIYITIPVTTA